MTKPNDLPKKTTPLQPRLIRGDLIVHKLEELYPDAVCTLSYAKPYQLLISGILASQCTDERVNKVTKILFARYPEIDDLANASIPQLIDCIRSCGFYNTKSTYIKNSMQLLRDYYEGEVPSKREDLISFPGVGRKIANLIMGDNFNIPAIVVDTHCSRISRHFGMTDEIDVLKIENDLMKYIPKEHWISYGHRIVAHGRAVCKARNPQCDRCGLVKLCRKGMSHIDP